MHLLFGTLTRLCVCIYLGCQVVHPFLGSSAWLLMITSLPLILLLLCCFLPLFSGLFPNSLWRIWYNQSVCLFFGYPAFTQYMFLHFFFFLAEAASFILVPVSIVCFYWHMAKDTGRLERCQCRAALLLSHCKYLPDATRPRAPHTAGEKMCKTRLHV